MVYVFRKVNYYSNSNEQFVVEYVGIRRIVCEYMEHFDNGLGIRKFHPYWLFSHTSCNLFILIFASDDTTYHFYVLLCATVFT